MAKKTLLQLVQSILNDMDSDNVNSITDTEESMQVVSIIHDTYEELINNSNWPHLGTLLQLTASGDSNKPSHMSIPDEVQTLNWIRYDKKVSGATAPKWEEVEYMEAADFLAHVMGRDTSQSNISAITDYSGTTVHIKTDAAPTYWTTFDDENIVFDSYDSAVDTTLQSSKTQVHVIKEPAWSETDTFIPDLPSKAFPLLLAEAKSVCFMALKQMANSKEEQKARRQRTWMSRKRWVTNGGIKYPNYGRK